MACKLSMQCDLIFGIIKCTIPEDTVDVDLKVCTLRATHTYRKDRSTQNIKYSPWGTKVQPYPSLKRRWWSSLNIDETLPPLYQQILPTKA